MPNSVFFQSDSPKGLNGLISISLVTASLCLPTYWFNITIFRVLNGWHSPISDVFWVCWTTMGDGYLLGIILGCFIVYHPRITVMGLAALLMSGALTHIFKAMFPIERPAAVLEAVHVVGPVLRFGSFPSGHTAAAMSVALTLYSFAVSRLSKLILILAATLVGLSRIFVGAHFPLDVVTGTLVAASSFLVCKGLLWSCLVKHVWQKPAWENVFFRTAYRAELIAGFGALLMYSPLFAESVLVGGIVSAVVIVWTLKGSSKAS